MSIINLILFVAVVGLAWLKQPEIPSILLGVWGILMYFLDTKNVTRSWKLTVVLGILLLSVAVYMPFSNVIQNGGFEDGRRAWMFIQNPYPIERNLYGLSRVSFDIEGEVTKVHKGGKSLEVVNEQEKGHEKYGLVYQAVKVHANASYDISFYVKGVVNPGTLWISIRDNWFKPEGRYEVPAKTYLEWTEIKPDKKLIAHDSDYANFKIISTAPGRFFVDDIYMKWDIIDTLRRFIKSRFLRKTV